MQASKYQKALARVGLDDGSSLTYLKSIGATPEITEPYKYLEEKGITVIKLNKEQMNAFKEATAGVREKWRKEIGEDLVKAAEQDMTAVQ